MIRKDPESGEPSKDRRQRAGVEAERQMSFYLRRVFETSADLLVINDLRIVDPEQPDLDPTTGQTKPGVAQIDHLIVHRFGMFIIESKSVTGKVTVRDDGGGDEWTRSFGSKVTGFRSPIGQAKDQGVLLRAFLQRHRTQLLGKLGFGTATLARAVRGDDQRGFRCLPIQIVVAISDSGEIQRAKGWQAPSIDKFESFVLKADQVADRVRDEFRRHGRASKLTTRPDGEYGLWSMKDAEVHSVVDFLIASHTPKNASVASSVPMPREKRPTPANHNAVCGKCGSTDISPRSGKYGYYFKCAACDGNTPMAGQCERCGMSDRKSLRVRKEGPRYMRNCSACGLEAEVWVERS